MSFVMVQVEHDAVEVDFDEGRARLRVRRLEVFDDHGLANPLTQGLGFPTPLIAPVFPVHATVSFDVRWNGILDSAQFANKCAALQGHVPQHGRHD